jgi:UDP-galactopyranose mutase
MKDETVIVVGAGLTGAAVARELADSGLRIEVFEGDDDVGGNCREGKILGRQLHLHGPHLFHTNDQKIWEFVQRFGSWRRYEHRVVTEVDQRLVPLPFNLKTLEKTAMGLDISEQDLIDFCGPGGKTTVLRLLNAVDSRMQALGSFIFKNFFEGYSKKQWGNHFDMLDDSVLSRVPIRASFDDRYFDDVFQALPVEGYSSVIKSMLDHPEISTMTARFFSKADLSNYAQHTIVFTGAVDELIAPEEEGLPYRSLSFRYVIKSESEHGLTHLQTNFPNRHEYTRISNYSHVYGSEDGLDLLVYEYPSEYSKKDGARYYPIPSKPNALLHQDFLKRLSRLHPDIWVAGRLGDYKYYNMDQAIARGRKLAKDILERKAGGAAEL